MDDGTKGIFAVKSNSLVTGVISLAMLTIIFVASKEFQRISPNLPGIFLRVDPIQEGEVLRVFSFSSSMCEFTCSYYTFIVTHFLSLLSLLLMHLLGFVLESARTLGSILLTCKGYALFIILFENLNSVCVILIFKLEN